MEGPLPAPAKNRDHPETSVTILVARQPLAKNTALLVGAQLTPLLVAVVAIPILVSRVGLTRLGILTLAWVILGYAGVLDLGIARAATKKTSELLAAHREASIRELGTSAITANFILGVGGALLFVAIVPMMVSLLRVPAELTAETNSTFIVLSLGIPFTLAMSASRSVIEGAQRFDLVSLVAAPSSAATYIVPAAGAVLGLSLPVIVGLLIVARIGTLLAYLSFWRRAFPEMQGSARPSWLVARSLLGYGGWLTASSVSVPLIVYGERAIIASLITVAGLGLYVIPYELVARMWVIPGALAVTLFPAFAAMRSASGVERGETFQRSLKFLACMLGPVGVVLISFGHPILERWVGAEIADATSTALSLFAVGGIVGSFAYVPLAFLQASGRASASATLHLAEIPAAYVLTWAFTAQFGLIGAAVAWLVRVIVDASVLFVLAMRASQDIAIAVRATLWSVFVVAVALAVAAFDAAILPVGPRLLAASVSVVAVTGSLWRFGLTEADRRVLRRWLLLPRSHPTPVRSEDPESSKPA